MAEIAHSGAASFVLVVARQRTSPEIPLSGARGCAESGGRRPSRCRRQPLGGNPSRISRGRGAGHLGS